MDFTTLPTDNLYKFQALSGIALVILSLYLVFNFSKIIYKQFFKLLYDRENLKFKTDLLEKHMKRVDKELTKLEIIQSESKLKNMPDIESLNTEKFEVDLEKVKILHIQTQEKSSELMHLQKRLKIQLSQMGVLLIAFAILYFTVALIMFKGVKLSEKGFNSWYEKVQIYQDIIIQNQSREK